MIPSKRDVALMVGALFTLVGGLERARRTSPGAGTLGLLEVVAARQQVRPSEIAELQQVHPSLVTCRVRSLEDAGYLEVSIDPADHRSCLVSLTSEGDQEVRRLREIGIERFAKFVADWEPSEVRTFTALLQKLEASKAAVAACERRPAGRRWAQQRPSELRIPGNPAKKG